MNKDSEDVRLQFDEKILDAKECHVYVLEEEEIRRTEIDEWDEEDNQANEGA